MNYEDFNNFKIKKEPVVNNTSSLQRGVWIPAVHKETRDTVELNTGSETTVSDTSRKKDYITVTKSIFQQVFKPASAEESDVPEHIKKYDEREQKFYSECMKWEAGSEEKISELVEYISQMSDYAKEAVLDENFNYIARAEQLFEKDERIISAFQDGRISKGDVFGIAQLNENQAECIMDLLQNRKFTTFLEMNKDLGMFGLESLADIEEYLEENPAAFGAETNRSLDYGFDVFTSLALAFNFDFRAKVEDFVNDGYSDETSLMLANVQNLPNFDVKEVARLSENICKDADYDMQTAQYLSDFLNSEENVSLDLNDFNSYIESINIDDLREIAPQVKEYGGKEMLKFADFHYKSGTEEFNRETLTLPGDFTSFLMQNYINADELTELFAVYPLTSRNVGTMPENWLENRSDKDKASEEIYSAVTNFQKTNNKEEFEQELSKITGKETKIKRLGSGHYGTGYKISMQGCDDMCLKIFKTGKITGNINNIHGQHIEVQTGLFVNEHSNDFVKMYFGRVSPGSNDDGFIVTQFLSEDTKPVETGTGNTDKYLIISSDTSGNANTIHGKIIDYGSVTVDMRKAE